MGWSERGFGNCCRFKITQLFDFSPGSHTDCQLEGAGKKLDCSSLFTCMQFIISKDKA